VNNIEKGVWVFDPGGGAIDAVPDAQGPSTQANEEEFLLLLPPITVLPPLKPPPEPPPQSMPLLYSKCMDFHSIHLPRYHCVQEDTVDEGTQA